MAYCVDRIAEQGVEVEHIILVGGGARSQAIRRIAPAILNLPVNVPTPAEYVALGAARQAAWTLPGRCAAGLVVRSYGVLRGRTHPQVVERYQTVQRLTEGQ